MNQRTAFLMSLNLVYALLHPVYAQTESALQVIIDLGRVNGQALACKEMTIAAQAKSLMLLHAPKTARFGDAFEDSTQQAFVAQLRSEMSCPDEVVMSAQLVSLKLELQASLPNTTPTTPTSGTQ